MLANAIYDETFDDDYKPYTNIYPDDEIFALIVVKQNNYSH